MPKERWHTAVAVLAGLLLPLPLLLLWGLLRPEVLADASHGVHISPVLTHEQRLRLVSYGRACGPGGTCELPLGCLYDGRSWPPSTCTDSQCLTDAQCLEGQVCRILATSGGGPFVRRCAPVGPRQEGESCVELPKRKENACAAQWLCGGGAQAWCARSCSLADAASCPAGFFCADTVPQPLCLPTCTARGCPSGQQCIPLEEGVSVCARVYGPQCQQTACPGGLECHVDYEPAFPGKVWMECVQPCEEGGPSCGAGKVCDNGHCLPACDPQGPPDACGEGYHCSRSYEQGPFSCQPLYWDWTMGI